MLTLNPNETGSSSPKASTLHEVLSVISKTRGDLKKAKMLQEASSKEVKTVLRGAFDPRIVFLLPEGMPLAVKLLEGPHGVKHAFINACLDKFPYFIKGGPGENLKSAIRERMFIEALSVIHADDARLLVAMKDKKLPSLYPGITFELVDVAFPGLLGK